MGARKKFNSDVEILDAVEDYEEGFIEGDIKAGKPIATFSFGMSNNKPIAEPQSITNKTNGPFLFNDKTTNSSQSGKTPAVDGELYTIKRGYQLRPSTLRKLNEIKARHNDVNVYLNTIIDEAILHYYDYLFNRGSN